VPEKLFVIAREKGKRRKSEPSTSRSRSEKRRGENFFLKTILGRFFLSGNFQPSLGEASSENT
jgi:hypothetical protein